MRPPTRIIPHASTNGESCASDRGKTLASLFCNVDSKFEKLLYCVMITSGVMALSSSSRDRGPIDVRIRLVRWQNRMFHAVTRIDRVNDENLSNQSERASDTRILQAY